MNNWKSKSEDRHELISGGRLIAIALSNGTAIVQRPEGGNLHNVLSGLAEAKLWASDQVARLGY